MNRNRAPEEDSHVYDVRRPIFGNSSRTRRSLVVVMYVALMIVPVLFLSGLPAEVLSSKFIILVGIVAFLSSLAIHETLKTLMQGVVDQKSADLDERQETIRNRAYKTAYTILFPAATTMFLYLALASTSDEIVLWQPLKDSVWIIYTTFLWLFITLPTALIAWTEPDPAPDE